MPVYVMTGIGFWMKSVALLSGKFDSLRRSQPIQVRRVFYDESQPCGHPCRCEEPRGSGGRSQGVCGRSDSLVSFKKAFIEYASYA